MGISDREINSFRRNWQTKWKWEEVFEEGVRYQIAFFPTTSFFLHLGTFPSLGGRITTILCKGLIFQDKCCVSLLQIHKKPLFELRRNAMNEKNWTKDWSLKYFEFP